MSKRPKEKAHGTHYFGVNGFPIAAVRVRSMGTGKASHPHDLTEVEHNHDFNELVLVVKGRGVQHLEGVDYPVQAGDIYILQRRHQHFFYRRDGLELINIMYDPTRLTLPETQLRKIPGYSALFLLEPKYRRQHRFRSRLHLTGVTLAKAEQLAEAILHESASDEPGREAALTAQLIALITHLARSYAGTTSLDGQALLRLGRTLGAMESDPARAWTLQELARYAHLSPSHFSRVFRHATGTAPMTYLTRLRMQEAMRRLRQPDATITEIALATGFNDSNYFARQFKRHTGTTPRAYRRATQE